MHNVADVIGDREPFRVQAGSTVREVVEYLCDRRVGAVAVCAHDRVVGVFSERDLLRRVVRPGLDPAETRVDDVMSSTIFSVRPDANHRVAKQMMMDNNVRHLVVMDEEDRLRGFVSMRELIEADLAEQRELVHKLNDDYYQRAFKPGKQKI